MPHYQAMEKNLGILLGGIAVAGAVAFLSINPAGSNQGSSPTPVISTSANTPSSTSSTNTPSVSAKTTITPVDQSTSQVATTPKPLKATSIGSTGRGGEGDDGEGNDD
jgi:hypothetical protein